MRTEEPNLGAYIDAFKELARCEHLLDYALITGKAPAHAAAYADLAALAAQVEDGVTGFVARQSALTLDQEQLKRLTTAMADLK
jgi:hypothetical protein